MGFAQTLQNPNELWKSIIPQATFIGSGNSAIEIDVLRIDERVNRWEITRYPVEKGLDISDVRYKLPDFVRIEGTLTDTQLDPRSIGTTLLATGRFGFSTWQDKKKALEELANSNGIIEITTRMHFYPKMQIRFLRAIHDKDTSGCYPFVLEAEEIRVVSSTSVEVDPALLPKEQQDQETEEQKTTRRKKKKPKNKGKKPPKETTKEDRDPARLLGDIWKSITGG